MIDYNKIDVLLATKHPLYFVRYTDEIEGDQCLEVSLTDDVLSVTVSFPIDPDEIGFGCRGGVWEHYTDDAYPLHEMSPSRLSTHAFSMLTLEQKLERLLEEAWIEYHRIN